MPQEQEDPYADDETLYSVEGIEDKIKKKGHWYYVIKWEGFEERTLKSLSAAEEEIPNFVEKFEGRKCLKKKRRRSSRRSSSKSTSRSSSKRATSREPSSDEDDTEIVPSPSRKRMIVESDEEEIVHFLSEGDVSNQNGCENQNVSSPVKGEMESEVSSYVLATPKPKKRKELRKRSSINASTNGKRSSQRIQMINQLVEESDDSSSTLSTTLETRCEMTEEHEKEPAVSSLIEEEISLPVKVEPVQENYSRPQSCLEKILDEKHLFSTPIADDVAYHFIVPAKSASLFRAIDLSKCKLLKDMVDDGEVKILFLDMRKHQIFTDLTGRRRVHVFNDGDDLLNSISTKIVEFLYGSIVYRKTEEKRLLIKLKNVSDNIVVNIAAKRFIDKFPRFGNLLADQIAYYTECIDEIDTNFELCDENIDLVKNSAADSKSLAKFIPENLKNLIIAEEEELFWYQLSNSITLKLFLETAKVWARSEIQSVENDDSFNAVKRLFESRDMMYQNITEESLSSWLNMINVYFNADIVNIKTDLIISTKYGKIQGFEQKFKDGFKVEMFLGIPYAKSPIEDLRFKKSKSPTRWTTIYKATNYGDECPGLFSTSDKIPSENCLFMNIAKPKSPPMDPDGYPVFFWIHGGAFITGSGTEYHNSSVINNLVKKGFIFVSINYRLGPFGFFSDGTKDYPGNYGLWDQVQALKFLQDILPELNGNPYQITVFGESAGGASTSWLTLHQDSKDLFSKAVIMSGSHQCIHANSDDTLESSKLLLKQFGTVERLKAASMDEIHQASIKQVSSILRQDSVNFNHWNPRLDGVFLKSPNFEEAIKNAPKRPILLGLTSQEHIMFALPTFYKPGKFMPFDIEALNNFNEKKFKDGISFILGKNGAYGSRQDDAIGKVIDFYSNEKEKYLKHQYLNAFVQLFSDLAFNVPVMREAKLKAAAGHKVYFYFYDHILPEMVSELFEGASHTTELITIFGTDLAYPKASKLDADFKQIREYFLEMLTTFAVDSEPSSGGLDLPLVTPNKIPFIKFGKSIVSLGEDLWPERLAFWDQMAEEFGYDWVTGTWTTPEKQAKFEL
uniref:Chromo domain-containing protein n=1 Tax=Panagrolaimus sp. JU765 TaxID=591449 RepID=A0AC34QI17_9BILA